VNLVMWVHLTVRTADLKALAVLRVARHSAVVALLAMLPAWLIALRPVDRRVSSQ
jgi:hypothetical protein